MKVIAALTVAAMLGAVGAITAGYRFLNQLRP